MKHDINHAKLAAVALEEAHRHMCSESGWYSTRVLLAQLAEAIEDNLKTIAELRGAPMNPLLRPALDVLEAWAADSMGASNECGAVALIRLFASLENNWAAEYQAAFKRGVEAKRQANQRQNSLCIPSNA